MKTIKFLAIALFCVTQLNAQVTRPQARNEVYVLSGAGGGLWEDGSSMPNDFGFDSRQWQVGYQHLDVFNNLWQFRGLARGGSLSASDGNPCDSGFIAFSFDAAWLMRLHANENWQFYLGPKYALNTQVMNGNEFETGTPYSYFSTQDFAASFRTDFRQGAWTFSAQADLPLFSYVAKSGVDFNGELDLVRVFDDGDFHGLHGYFAPELMLSARYELVSWFDLMLQYDGSLGIIPDGDELTFGAHHVSVGGSFKF